MARTGSRASDSLLLLAVLKRIPHNRWISTVELMNELEEAGTPFRCADFSGCCSGCVRPKSFLS